MAESQARSAIGKHADAHVVRRIAGGRKRRNGIACFTDEDRALTCGNRSAVQRQVTRASRPKAIEDHSQ